MMNQKGSSSIGGTHHQRISSNPAYLNDSNKNLVQMLNSGAAADLDKMSNGYNAAISQQNLMAINQASY